MDGFCATVRSLEPTFGGINLEDIKAPEAFEIEKRLRETMKIPVFHDDQHGTAIVAAAAIMNALTLVDKRLDEVRITATGGGAACIACLDLLLALGVGREQILLCDREGVIYTGRPGEKLHSTREAYAQDTDKRTLSDAMAGADIFLGLSVGGTLDGSMIASMAPRPIILALANPEPEVRPEVVHASRDDAIVATGRSDYANQVNNVLCFPFIFRGALDVGATQINEAMKKACAEAIARLARTAIPDVVLSAYRDEVAKFGRDYIIPKPFDPRLVVEVSSSVAQAAMDSGVATRPIEDMSVYRQGLSRFVYRSGLLMKPIFSSASRAPKLIAFAEGEDNRVLHAASQIVSAGVARPLLVGNRERMVAKAEALDLALDFDGSVGIFDPRLVDIGPYADLLHELAGRRGVSPDEARRGARNDRTSLALLLLRRGEVDGVICGTNGRFGHHLERVRTIIGEAPGVSDLSTLSGLVTPAGTIFIADSYVTPDPSADEIVELTLLAASSLRDLGIEPRVALVSHSNFGDRVDSSSRKMREATSKLRARRPFFAFDGEMHVDAALKRSLRDRVMSSTGLEGSANLLIMPNLDAAHISLGLLKTMTNGVVIGPLMLGSAQPVQVASQSVTVRGLLNASAILTVLSGSVSSISA